MDTITQLDLEYISKDLCNLYIKPVNIIGVYKTRHKHVNTHRPRPAKKKTPQNKPCFDNECKHRRDEYITVKNRLKKIKSDEAKIQLKNKAKQYK